MKSRITIEVDFDHDNSPVIQLIHYPDSEDVRDRLIKNFLEKLAGSSWCQLKYVTGGSDFNRIHISPIPSWDLNEHSETMSERYTAYKQDKLNKELS